MPFDYFIIIQKLNAILNGQKYILHVLENMAAASHKDDAKLKALSKQVKAKTAELQAAIDAVPDPAQTTTLSPDQTASQTPNP